MEKLGDQRVWTNDIKEREFLIANGYEIVGWEKTHKGENAWYLIPQTSPKNPS